MKSATIKFVLIIAITGAALYYLIPSIRIFINPTAKKTNAWFEDYLPDKNLKLGLDLQGGIHLVLGVDTERAFEGDIEKYSDVLKTYLKEQKIPVKQIEKPLDKNIIAIVLENQNDKDRLLRFIKDKFTIFNYDRVQSTQLGADSIALSPEPRWEKQIKNQTLEQAIQTIRNRIDEFGVTEPSIQRQGTNRIVVQLPGIKNPDRALEIIRKTALLEFKLVDGSMVQKDLENLIAGVQDQLPHDYTAEDVNKLLADKLPPESAVYFEVRQDKTSGQTRKIPWLLNKKTLLTGDSIEDARVRQDSTGMGQAYVSLQFSQDGALHFEKITEENVGKLLAIVLDGNLNSAPRIREKISQEFARAGNVKIELNTLQSLDEMYEEASNLVIVLRAGSLPAPIVVEENRTVGPSLGADSITKGMNSVYLGSLIVVLFMLVYYGFSGLIANIALIINLIFIFAILAAFQATLTLPGIAGIALTVGMAVDGNIIIFERIREELKTGKTPKSAVALGFERANITVFDANLTTLIAGIVLYQYGTGPVQGFAVTLMIGLVCTYITNVPIARALFDFSVEVLGLKKLSIG